MAQILILAGDTIPVRTMMMSLQVEGFTPTRISNSDQLIQRFTADNPLAILCDLSAPWSSLASLLRRLRAHTSGRKVYIGLFGSVPPEATDDALQSLGISSDDLYPEPIDIPQLSLRIQSAAATKEGGSLRTLEISTNQIPTRGSLNKTPLSHVLYKIDMFKGCGQLELTIDGQQGALSFKDGGLREVLIPRGPLVTASWLAAHGHIPKEALKGPIRPDEMTFGLLAAQGHISLHSIPELARAHAEAVIALFIQDGRGKFVWREGAVTSSSAFSLGVNLKRTIVAAHQRSPQPLPVEVLTLQPGLDDGTRDDILSWGLPPFQVRAINQLNGTRTLESMLSTLAGDNNDRRAQLLGLIHALLAMGVIRVPEAQVEVIDWAARADQLKVEAIRMKDANPFEVLSIAQNVSENTARTRFFQLSKEYHPDLAYDAPEDVRILMAEIFREIQEAYEIVSDPKKRERYFEDKETEKAGLDVRAALQAEIEFTQGGLFLKNRNYSRAKSFFEKALELNPHAVEYQLYVGWTTFLDSPDDYQDAARLIHLALKSNDRLDKGYYFLGRIFKSRNEHHQAENAFKRAVAVNPNNVDARRELRLLGMRKDKASGMGEKLKKGLFGRFKK